MELKKTVTANCVSVAYVVCGLLVIFSHDIEMLTVLQIKERIHRQEDK